MAGKTALITGCSAGGIGHELAKKLAATGYTVFATVRTPLLVLDILVRALLKKGRVFVSLYVMAMAAAATLLLASPLADAK